MTQFFDKYPLLVFVFYLWLSGAILLFIWQTGTMLWRFIMRNSVRNRNLWLVGFESNWVDGLLLEKDPGEISWKEQLLGLTILMRALNSVISWIGIFAAVIDIIIALYNRLTTPAKIRELAWRARKIEYIRAEDYLQLMEESYLPGSTSHSMYNLQETRNRVEGIARRYAEKVFQSVFCEVFDDAGEAADKYVELARALSEKRFESKVIHPTFWMIPVSKAAAEHAVCFRF